MSFNSGKEKPIENNLTKTVAQSNTTDPISKERRSVLRKLAVGTAVLTGCSVLPQKWTTPVVEFGVLPAHATTSGEDIQDKRGYENTLTIPNTGDKVMVDGIIQDKFIFPKLGPEYAKSFLIVWSDENELFIPDSRNMTLLPAPDARKYQPGYPYSEAPEITSMEVYAKRGTQPESVTLYY